MNILIVEDNKNLAQSLMDALVEKKHRVTVVHDGREGIDYGLDKVYNLIIMDVMMPVVDGLTVVRTLRKKGIATPILMLTACAEEHEKIEGLDCGADDYMTKPFSVNELMARVRALTRRMPEIAVDELSLNDLVLDLTTCELSKGDNRTQLSHREFELMSLLMRNRNRTFSKEDIIVNVWGYDSEVDDNNVEAYISFLRKKIVFLEATVTIRTVRKLGYVLEAAND